MYFRSLAHIRCKGVRKLTLNEFLRFVFFSTVFRNSNFGDKLKLLVCVSVFNLFQTLDIPNLPELLDEIPLIALNRHRSNLSPSSQVRSIAFEKLITQSFFPFTGSCRSARSASSTMGGNSCVRTRLHRLPVLLLLAET